MDLSADKHNMQALLERFPQQLSAASSLGKLKLNKPKLVTIFGIGGSAWPANIAQSIVNVNIPLTLVRDYALPAYISKDTLAMVISYSGNTEEALANYTALQQQKIPMVVITSGGELADYA